MHSEARVCRNDSHRTCLQVFTLCKCEESVYILLFHYNCHTFLRFTDGKFCPVKSFILTRYLIEINIQSLGKLADGNRYTARTKVVAAFDEPAGISVPEEALELTLLGCIALLHLGSAGFNGMNVVSL